MSRPSAYSEEYANRICEEIANGKSLRKICLAIDIPDRSTILRWLDTHPTFAAKYAHARELQGDWCDDEIAEVIEATKNGELKSDVARVVLEGQKWRAAKLRPKKYGDKLDLNHSGEVEISLTDKLKEARERAKGADGA